MFDVVKHDRVTDLPIQVATYDLAPKMTVEKVANNMVAEIEAGKHTFLVCNLAAPDMVGHTGIYEKATARLTPPGPPPSPAPPNHDH